MRAFLRSTSLPFLSREREVVRGANITEAVLCLQCPMRCDTRCMLFDVASETGIE